VCVCVFLMQTGLKYINRLGENGMIKRPRVCHIYIYIILKKINRLLGGDSLLLPLGGGH